MRTCAPATFNNPSIFHPHFSSVIVSFSTSFAHGEQVHISSIFEFYRYSRYLSSCYLNYNIMATHFSNHHIRGLIVLAHLIQFNLTHIHYLNTQIRTDKQAGARLSVSECVRFLSMDVDCVVVWWPKPYWPEMYSVLHNSLPPTNWSLETFLCILMYSTSSLLNCKIRHSIK